MTAKQIVIPGESGEEFEALRLALHEDFAPANTAEATLVGQIAEHTWRLRRARRAETAVWGVLMGDRSDTVAMAAALDNTDSLDLERIRRYEVTAERSYHRAIDQLRKLQKERRSVEKAAAACERAAAAESQRAAAKETARQGKNGFVSQPASPPSSAAPETGFVSQKQARYAACAVAGMPGEAPPAAA